MSLLRCLGLAASLALFPATAFSNEPPAAPAQVEQAADKCEQHGVKTTVCTRCNPKLDPVYKSKGDWCPEHSRPESQCVLCNPKLAEQGVK